MAPSFFVFAQRDDACFDADAFSRYARRFFDAEISLADEEPIDGVRVVLSSRSGGKGTRVVRSRETTAADFELAKVLEHASKNAGGLSLLARRCHRAWLVECVSGSADHVALRISAVLAGVDLGPILSPERDAIFGVKTARLMLERGSA